MNGSIGDPKGVFGVEHLLGGMLGGSALPFPFLRFHFHSLPVWTLAPSIPPTALFNVCLVCSPHYALDVVRTWPTNTSINY